MEKIECNDMVLKFENPSYDGCEIGTTHDGRLIYDFHKMIEYLMDEDGLEELEAIEFIEYNTLRALPYYNGSPLVVEVL